MLSDNQMNGPFLQPYAEKGHHFDAGAGKCVHCGCPAIDLYEDAAYGEIRSCIKDDTPMTNESAPVEQLSPCPFCGGEAKRFTIGEDEPDNAGGDVISCTRCGASSHVEFGRKENLVSRWNTRIACTPTAVDGDMVEAREAMLQTARELREHANGDCGAIMQAIRWEDRAKALSIATQSIRAKALEDAAKVADAYADDQDKTVRASVIAAAIRSLMGEQSS